MDLSIFDGSWNFNAFVGNFSILDLDFDVLLMCSIFGSSFGVDIHILDDNRVSNFDIENSLASTLEIHLHLSEAYFSEFEDDCMDSGSDRKGVSHI